MVMYQGNAPLESDGWELLTGVFDSEEREWLIYGRNSLCGKWLNVKLVASCKVENKANYWFGFNVMTKKYSNARDLGVLKENRPELFGDVDAILRHW